MNILKTTSFTWWQISVFKISVFSIGLAVGAYWSDFFSSYFELLIALGVITGVYITYVWVKQ